MQTPSGSAHLTIPRRDSGRGHAQTGSGPPISIRFLGATTRYTHRHPQFFSYFPNGSKWRTYRFSDSAVGQGHCRLGTASVTITNSALFPGQPNCLPGLGKCLLEQDTAPASLCSTDWAGNPGRKLLPHSSRKGPARGGRGWRGPAHSPGMLLGHTHPGAGRSEQIT